MFAITGATGHLGQTLLRQIRSRGDRVVAAVRSTSNRSLLSGYADRIDEAPLHDVDALTACFDGAEVVIHAAALIDIRRGRRAELDAANVGGTRNVLAACRRAGVRRLVYVSSIEAFDMSPRRRPIREDFGFARGNACMDYGESKAEASRLAAAAGLSGELETVLIAPTAIVGPWDYQDGPLTTMIRRFLAGKIPAALPGGFDYVDVRDVAGAVLAAADRGRSGESYLVSGEYLSVADLMTALERLTGLRGPRLVLPLPAVRVLAELSESWSRFSGRPALFTRGSVDVLQIDARIDPAKARDELGYRPRPIRESLEDTLTWIGEGSAVNPDPLFA